MISARTFHIRDALEALNHGIDLLDDKRLSDAMRRGAKLAWLTSRGMSAQHGRVIISMPLEWADLSLSSARLISPLPRAPRRPRLDADP